MPAVEREPTATLHGFPSVYIMETRLPDDMVQSLNDYLDGLLADQQRRSHAAKLAGQIKHGEQLTMDANHGSILPFSKLLCVLSERYVEQFYQCVGFDYQNKRTATVDAMWSVHSFAGDYNPMHDHATSALMGISTVLWTKVPEGIRKLPGNNGPISNASGNQDGFILFHFGVTSARHMQELRPPESWIVKPEVGKLLIFPCWLKHMVNPFACEGERRTVATNLSMWSPKAVEKMRKAAGE